MGTKKDIHMAFIQQNFQKITYTDSASLLGFFAGSVVVVQLQFLGVVPACVAWN